MQLGKIDGRLVTSALAGALLFFWQPSPGYSSDDFFGNAGAARKTLFAQAPVPQNCLKDYQSAFAVFADSVASGLGKQARHQLFESSRLGISGNECRFIYAMGLFDSQYLFIQRVILELGLELRHEIRNDARETMMADLVDSYRKRISTLELDTEVFEQVVGGSNFIDN